MRVVWLFLLTSFLGCEPKSASEDVVLPRVPPDTIIASWSVTSRSDDRDGVHAVLEASRKLTTTTRAPDGTRMSASRTISKKQYQQLVARLRELDCCQLSSTSQEGVEPAEAKPILQIDLGDVRCAIELWDREWREGLARECAVAFVQVHRGGFVPDPPVDGPYP
jgi:hypothetical protein